MEISVIPLKDALGHLENAILYASAAIDRNEAVLAGILTTGAVKSFEYTYAHAIKVMTRYLEDRLGPDAVATLNFRNLMRTAWEQHLITSLELWDEFREMRNVTAHTYDAGKAAQIFCRLPMFASAITGVLMQLEKVDHEA